MFNKKKPSLQVGLSENEHYYCLVYQQNSVFETIWQPKSLTLEAFLAEQAVKFSEKFTIIRPIPQQFIWLKYLLFPQSLSTAMLYRQLIQILQQELPVPLQDIYFDYHVSMLNESTQRVALYALKRSYADTHMTSRNTILDCELHCFVRGFHTFSTELEPFNTTFVMNNQAYQFCENALNISNEIPEQACTTEQLTLPEDIRCPHLYLTALGASLWNGKALI